MTLSIAVRLLISALLGAVIGLERESHEYRVDKTKNAGVGSLGIRTYILIASLGGVSGILYRSFFPLFLFLSVSFVCLLLLYYVLESRSTKDHGITTELAILWSFFIGLSVGLELFSIQLILAITIVLVLILSSKQKIKQFVLGIKQYELDSFISYAIVVLVVLPFLPNVGYTLKEFPFFSNILSAYSVNLGKYASLEIINPFSVWRIVAIITGVEIVGYILEKTIGQKKGWILTSIAGGFISSTSTTQSLAQQSKKNPQINQLTAAALFANLSSFVQHALLILSVNSLFLTKGTLYVVFLILSGLFVAFYFYQKKQDKKGPQLSKTRALLKNDRIFSLQPALQFALIFLLIKIGSKLALIIFGDRGFIVANILGALTGLDAVTFNISEIAGKTVSYQLGIITLILANAVNLLSKSVYVYTQGNRRFASNFLISTLIIIASTILGFGISLRLGIL